MSTSTPFAARVRVTRLSDDGRGVAQFDLESGVSSELVGKTVFVDQALPNEEVQIEVYNQQPKLCQAAVTKKLTTSSQRVSPECKVYEQCGGCQLQHLNYPAQLEFKTDTLRTQLLRHGLIDTLEVSRITPSLPTHYRNRIRLGAQLSNKLDQNNSKQDNSKQDNPKQLSLSPAKLTVGFRAKSSHELVSAADCVVAHPKLLPLLADLEAKLGALDCDLSQLNEVLLDTDGNQSAVTLVTNQNFNKKALLPLKDWLEPHKAALWQHSFGNAQKLFGPELSYTLEPFKIKISYQPTDFTQANHALNVALVQHAAALLKLENGHKVLDLFCGLGNFSLPLATSVGATGKVVGVEGSTRMCARAAKNAALNQLDQCTEFVSHNLNKPLPKTLKQTKFDAALLDPPRAGAKQLCTELGKLEINTLVYVSCNLATLLRDAKILTQAGYQITHASAFDMFAQSAHMEVVLRFEKT